MNTLPLQEELFHFDPFNKDVEVFAGTSDHLSHGVSSHTINADFGSDVESLAPLHDIDIITSNDTNGDTHFTAQEAADVLAQQDLEDETKPSLDIVVPVGIPAPSSKRGRAALGLLTSTVALVAAACGGEDTGPSVDELTQQALTEPTPAATVEVELDSTGAIAQETPTAVPTPEQIENPDTALITVAGACGSAAVEAGILPPEAEPTPTAAVDSDTVELTSGEDGDTRSYRIALDDTNVESSDEGMITDEETGLSCSVDVDMTGNGTDTIQAVVTPTEVPVIVEEEQNGESDPFENLTPEELERLEAFIAHSNEDTPDDLKPIVEEIGGIYLSSNNLDLVRHSTCSDIPEASSNLVIVPNDKDQPAIGCGYDSATGTYYLEDYLDKIRGDGDVNEAQSGSCQGPGINMPRMFPIIVHIEETQEVLVLETTCYVSIPGATLEDSNGGIDSPVRFSPDVTT